MIRDFEKRIEGTLWSGLVSGPLVSTQFIPGIGKDTFPNQVATPFHSKYYCAASLFPMVLGDQREIHCDGAVLAWPEMVALRLPSG